MQPRHENACHPPARPRLQLLCRKNLQPSELVGGKGGCPAAVPQRPASGGAASVGDDFPSLPPPPFFPLLRPQGPHPFTLLLDSSPLLLALPQPWGFPGVLTLHQVFGQQWGRAMTKEWISIPESRPHAAALNTSPLCARFLLFKMGSMIEPASRGVRFNEVMQGTVQQGARHRRQFL